MTHRRLGLVIGGSIAAAALLVAAWATRFAGTDRRPNVLLVSLCSVRVDHMSCYGYPRATTPHLAALAGEALVFEHAVTAWPKTAPAFAALVTAKYPHTTGVMRVTPGQRLGDEHETLAELLRARGYDTGAFITTVALSQTTNILQGFDTIVETWRQGSFREVGRYREATRALTAWVRARRTRPFFAWVHYNNAHYPYHAPGADRDTFVDDATFAGPPLPIAPRGAELPLVLPADHPHRHPILRPDVGTVHREAVVGRRHPQTLAFYVARYDAGIVAADRMIGELLDALRPTGVLDDTIVAVVGDHGESLGDHDYYFEHGRFPYDDCARVPLIIRPPGGGPPVRVATPVPAIGLAPTLLAMLDLPAPAAMEADSLLPVAAGRAPGGYVFSESGYHFDYMVSVRDERWKLVHVPNPLDRSLMTGSEYELYDLEADPGELDDRHRAEPDVTRRLREALEEWTRPWVAEAHRPTTHAAMDLDPTTREQLRSLGYLR